MSAISDIIDQLYVILATQYPAPYVELNTPYNLQTNPDRYLKNGYGIRVGAGSDTQELNNRLQSETRSFGVVITKEVFDINNNTASRKSVEKFLLEQRIIISKLISSDSIVNGLCEELDYASDDGIVAVEEDSDRFLSIVINFDLKYSIAIKQ